jgi:hypothetical protein
VRPQWYLDLFCGSGKVGNELSRRGHLVYYLDRVLGPRGDLCARRTLDVIAQDAGAGRVLGSMIAPPCSSHSRIQQISADGPLRTPDHPEGVPWLAGARLERVVLGNKTARSAARICRMLLNAGVPFIVENPALSFIWQQPGFRRLLSDSRVEFVTADQCLFGSRWRKRTGFLCGNIPSEDLQKLTCKCSSRGGKCDRTDERHVHLIGGAPGGGSMTSQAQNYPPALAKLLCSILASAAAERVLLARGGA